MKTLELMRDGRKLFCTVLAVCMAVGIFTAGYASSQSLQAASDRAARFEGTPSVPMANFDKLHGVWQVESHSLKDRMSGEAIWQENHMQTEYRVLLGGLVVVNDTYGTFNDRPMHGLMFRAYDPDKDEWVFQWMSKGYPHLTEQVRGRFENGIGVFYGTETNKGREFHMRFRWKMISENHAFWEQAYQHPGTGDWEVNWTLDLRRDSGR